MALFQRRQAGACHRQRQLELHQVNPAVNACIAGSGVQDVSLLPGYAGSPAGELELVLTDFEPDPLPLSLVFPHRRLSSTRLRIFVDWMAEAMQSPCKRTNGLSHKLCSILIQSTTSAQSG